MIRPSWFFIIYLLFSISCFGQVASSYFASPLDPPLVVVGTFGEIRTDHFHSGIDLGTNEEEGKNVYAVGDGYVSRIKVAPDGFGKAIYITHQGGFVTVYAHLKKFNPIIEKYINKIQYEAESYSIDHYTKPNTLPVKLGEVIASSGSTGGAEGPHLHFEVRDEKTEWPMNPLSFLPKIADNVAPKISKVKIFSLRHAGAVINAIESATYHVSDESGEHKVLGPQVINVFGAIGLGIETSDKMNAAGKSYNLGIASIELKLDGVRKYFFQFNQFSFDETRYVNAHIDYEEAVLHNARIQRCFRLPGNLCSIDSGSLNGELDLTDGMLHDAEFIVSDFEGNIASLHLALQSHIPLSELAFPSSPENAIVINEKIGINFNTDDIHLRIPAGAVYEEAWLSISKEKGSKNSFSPLHHVGERTIPVHIPYTLEIKADIPAALQHKACIVSYGKNNAMKYEGGEYKNGFVSASVRRFGDFEVMIDTIPPAIRVIEMPVNLVQQLVLPVIEIKDNLSGIASYKITIDKKFFLMEHDAKTGLLTSEGITIKKNKKHILELTVTDKKGNTSLFKTDQIY